jgi:integrase
MADDINVILVKRKGRKFLYMRYTCPLTGETFEKSSEATTESEARKQAGKWQAELVAGGGHTRSAKWSDFRSRYEDGKAFGLRPKTVSKVSATFNVIEEVMKPDSVKRITPQWLTLLQKRLLDGGRTPATVESICRHLKAAMNWAREQDIISSVPKFPRLNKVRTAKQMRGRPITAEEFERMLAAVDSVWPDFKHDRNNANQRREQQRESIRFLLRGLWFSGLRLGEALGLTWDQWADGIRVDMSGKFVKLLIPMESEKGGQDRVYPVTPDFAELLRSVPEQDRTGKVFSPILYRGVCDRTDTVSRAITAIGEAAKVKVDEKPPRGTKNPPATVWASAHDLRRAFGARWSRKVNSMVLKELMRHSSVTTTEKYYVGINADETAALLAALSPSQVTLEVTHRKNATFQDEETAKTGRI